MGAAALPAAITGGLGLVGGYLNNQSQQRQANQANALAQSQIGRQNQLFDTIMNLANQNVGSLSADSQIANLAKDQSFWNAQQLQGTAAAMKTAGYQPGDSEIQQNLNRVNENNQLGFMEMANRIRTQAPMEQEALFTANNPGSLNAGIQYGEGQQALHYGMMSNPAGFIGAISPFLNPQMYRNGFQTQTSGNFLNNAGNWGANFASGMAGRL